MSRDGQPSEQPDIFRLRKETEAKVSLGQVNWIQALIGAYWALWYNDFFKAVVSAKSLSFDPAGWPLSLDGTKWVFIGISLLWLLAVVRLITRFMSLCEFLDASRDKRISFGQAFRLFSMWQRTTMVAVALLMAFPWAAYVLVGPDQLNVWTAAMGSGLWILWLAATAYYFEKSAVTNP